MISFVKISLEQSIIRTLQLFMNVKTEFFIEEEGLRKSSRVQNSYRIKIKANYINTEHNLI